MFILFLGFPGGSDVKNPPAVQETWVQSLGWEDPLEEGVATHSSTLAWRIPRTEDPGRLQSTGSESDTAEQHSPAHPSPLKWYIFDSELLRMKFFKAYSTSKLSPSILQWF